MTKVEKNAALSTATQGARNLSTPLVLWVGIGLFVVLSTGYVLLVVRTVPEKIPSVESHSRDTDSPDTDSLETSSAIAVDDESQLLWESPTSGDPIKLSYVPLGSQLLLHVRPSELLSHPEGDFVLDSLGPWGERTVETLQEISSAELKDVESLLVCIHPSENGSLSYTFRCELVEPWSESQFAERFPNSNQSSIGEKHFFIVNERAYFLPDVAEKTLVICPLETVEEMFEYGSDGPPLARDILRLLRKTDVQRTATLVFLAKFLQTSGSALFQGTGADLPSVLKEVVGEDATTVALSAHWEEDFFLELLSTLALKKPAHLFSSGVQQRLSRSAKLAADKVSAGSMHPYGRQVVERFPEMLRLLNDYTRSGEEEGVSVMRCYLPVAAGHNLLMAAELLLNTQTTSQIETGLNPATETVAAKLQRVTSLSFTKETLERALEMLSQDLGLPIVLRGSDLQLEGITKNQSFEIDLRNRPAAEVLGAVLQKANPDQTSISLSDPRQKLVYTIRTATEGQPGVIVVTTRSAAISKGHKLPAVFESEPP